ncbi:RecX family transcriptional regulator [Sphingobium sufflavum]|uniref:regulatory protein RecX n=1 Tax=Sphingobium sufflavum TaxID=1129547 RepID=UPI001F1C424A|nr:RecX family transcriptional regulator [Sphingobium sufflavum]MCE7796204.1 RecX family transcriptional regulator [Sphingobium sufflavum]
MTPNRQKPAPKPLDSTRLEELALHYAARYATSRAKLSTYLRRKLRERGWAGEDAPDVAALVGRLADLRYVDDGAFATMRGTALARRGYGTRRIAAALDEAGIAEEDRGEAMARSAGEGWQAANILARRKRIGPYAGERVAREDRQKQIAAFIRAGHDFATAARWVDAAPGEMPPGGEDGDED